MIYEHESQVPQLLERIEESLAMYRKLWVGASEKRREKILETVGGLQSQRKILKLVLKKREEKNKET